MPDTALLESPRPAPADDDSCHLWCCDEAIAMCGLDVSTMDPCAHDREECSVCPMCALVEQEGLPCPAPGCRGGGGSAGG